MKAFSLWRGMVEVRGHKAIHGSRAELRRMAEAFCERTGVSLMDLTGKRRERWIAHPRQDFMAEAYSTRRYSLPEIGRFLNRDHTTVLHGVRASRVRCAAIDIPTREETCEARVCRVGRLSPSDTMMST